MATTSIWAVKGYLGKVVVYVENPDKTANPKSYEKPDMTEAERQGLADVIEYATNGEKTAKQYFVSGVNCEPVDARERMLLTKQVYGDKGGRVAFHGYQSFAPGEATPETAHEIGVRLAEELWGADFEVVVATHLDKDSHIHNHFVLNSVAFSDGHRFHNGKDDYRAMRDASDRLCREYGLSVVEGRQPRRTRHYAEWSAEQNGKPTWKSVIKADVDEAIRESMTDISFFNNLKKRGYEIKTGKDISVRPPGKERFVRLARNFGDGYTYDGICRRILRQTMPSRPMAAPQPTHRKHSGILSRQKRRKVGGLMGLYIHYQYLLGNLPRKRNPKPRKNSYALKEDLAKLDRISEETRLLCRNRIETAAQLEGYRSSASSKIEALTERRADLARKLKRKGHASEHDAYRAETKEITARLKTLRHEVRLCDEIAERSGVIRGKLSVISNEEKETNEMKRKEQDRHEQFR